MHESINPIALAIAFTVAIVIGIISASIGVAFLPPVGEEVTEQQYYEQSLQYLEDIRNSNDDILKALNK